VPSVSSVASPSAGEMAELIDLIKSSGAPAIFLDEVENPALAQQIADETGVAVITDLHLESLTDGPPAGTYIDMIKHNVTQIVEALK
jgi:zinc/manganese transport system substrate-binding protein